MRVSKIEENYNESHRVNRKNLIKEYKDNKDIIQELRDETGQESSFDDYKWTYYDEDNRCNRTIDFTMLYEFVKSNIITREEIHLIKCYVLDLLDEGYSPNTVSNKVRVLSYLIQDTECFRVDIIEGPYGENLLEKIIMERKANKDIHFSSIKDYFLFLEYNDVIDKKHKKAMELLNEINFINEHGVRELPDNREILAFDYYVKRFYREETNVLLRQYYFPILLWWRITNIIPMRASEITAKLKRECVVEEEGKYYLLINRAKQSLIKKKRHKPLIPLLDKIEITDEIYKLIVEYKNMTKFDETRITLLSNRAQYFWSKQLVDQGIKVVERKEKEKMNSYVRRDLSKLIDSFYNVVIYEKYQDKQIKQQLKVGDTRHLAFCSLMLQGLSPVEIALMGGHRHLRSQDSYIGHTKYYIDSEVLNFINSYQDRSEIDSKNLKSIILKKPNKNLDEIAKYRATEDKIGYCTVNLNQEIDVCESDRCCIFCSKWWCTPSNDNYVKAKAYIENNCIRPLQEILQNEEIVLEKLLQEKKIVNINGLIEMEKAQEENIRRQTMVIRGMADEIVFLKKKLLEIKYLDEEVEDEVITRWLDHESK